MSQRLPLSRRDMLRGTTAAAAAAGLAMAGRAIMPARNPAPVTVPFRAGKRHSHTPSPSPSSPVFELGISVSGAEPVPNDAQPVSQLFSNAVPGTYGSSYEYEGVTSTSTHNHLTFGFLAGRGWKTVKIPTRWERLTRNAAALTPTVLNSAEMALLDTEITEAASQGLSVIIDLHNYGQYYADGAFTGQAAGTGFTQALGTTNAGVTWSNAFASFWGAMASHYLANPAVTGFHLMNEPNASVGAGNLTQAAWYAAAQAAVTAIRAVDTTGRFILRVGGWAWSTCRGWTGLNGSPWITDPVGGPLWYEAHHYWDQFNSGGYTTYADAVADAVSHGYTTTYRGVTYPDALYSRVLDDLYQFKTWLGALHGVIGEAGWPNQAYASTADQASWNNLITVYLSYLGQLGNLNVDAWSCGESYSGFTTSMLSIYGASSHAVTGVNTVGSDAPPLEAALAAMG